MALKATIFKAELQITDTDRDYYHSHTLTLARHPSETDQRMMLRLLAFMLYASDSLQLTKGLSTDDEPELWQKSLSGEIELWIELGQPDERRIRKACGRSQQVVVITYGGRTADIWWQQQADKLVGIDNLTVWNIAEAESIALANLAERTMQLQATLESGQVWLSTSDQMLEITPQLLQQSVGANR